MVSVAASHSGPWTEGDLATLPDDGQRYELLEGVLLVSPSPSGRHQLVSLELAQQLKAACPPGLVVVEALGVRLPADTVFIPDVIVADRGAVLGAHGGIVDVGAARLVSEIVSPSSRTSDRLTKPALLAEAGLPFYWRVELDSEPTVFLYRLEKGGYVEYGRSRPGEPLVAGEPFPVTLDVAALHP
jgi:Uma2 family endonuclease